MTLQTEALRAIAIRAAEKDESLVARAFAALFAAILLWAPIAYFKGYVFVTLWQWFIAPLGYPAPSIYVAVGGIFALHAALPRPRVEEGKGFVQNTAAALSWPLSLLAFGALWHWLHWGVL